MENLPTSTNDLALSKKKKKKVGKHAQLLFEKINLKKN